MPQTLNIAHQPIKQSIDIKG